MVFSPEESVYRLRQRIDNHEVLATVQPLAPQAVHSRFQAARRAEEKMESENVRKALAEGSSTIL